MNRRKFIELLNLYIDGEIDPEDVSRLEEKIGRDEGARKIYNQYCRLHHGSQMIYERFRLQAPPEKVSERNRPGVLSWFPTRRLGRMAIAASGMAATIILVSGSVLLMQSGDGGESMEEIALTPVKTVESSSVVAVAPDIPSFNADTKIFELVAAGDGTLVPATWNPEINLPGESLSRKEAPVAWPASSGIQWETPDRITYPINGSVLENYRVYRSPRTGFLQIGEYQKVGFQFRK